MIFRSTIDEHQLEQEQGESHRVSDLLQWHTGSTSAVSCLTALLPICKPHYTHRYVKPQLKEAMNNSRRNEASSRRGDSRHETKGDHHNKGTAEEELSSTASMSKDTCISAKQEKLTESLPPDARAVAFINKTPEDCSLATVFEPIAKELGIEYSHVKDPKQVVDVIVVAIRNLGIDKHRMIQENRRNLKEKDRKLARVVQRQQTDDWEHEVLTEFHMDSDTHESWTLLGVAVKEDVIRRCRCFLKKNDQFLPTGNRALESWNNGDDPNQSFFQAIKDKRQQYGMGFDVDRYGWESLEGILLGIVTSSFRKDHERKIAEGWQLLAAFLMSDECPESYVELLLVFSQALKNGLATAKGQDDTNGDCLPKVIKTLDDLCFSNGFWQGENKERILDSLFVVVQTERFKTKGKKPGRQGSVTRETPQELKGICEEMESLFSRRRARSHQFPQGDEWDEVSVALPPTKRRPPLGLLDGNLERRRGNKK